jgi:hypothetical protein
MMDDFSKVKLVEALEAVRDGIKDLEERVIALEKLAAIHADILFHGDDKLQDLEVERTINWLEDDKCSPAGAKDGFCKEPNKTIPSDNSKTRISVVDYVQAAIKRGKK